MCIVTGVSTPKVLLISKLALKYKLYLDNGMLKLWYKYYPEDIEVAAIARFGNLLIGSAAFHKQDLMARTNHKVNCGFYVIPAFRRKGIGTQLFNAIKDKASRPLLVYDYGYRKDFFERVLV